MALEFNTIGSSSSGCCYVVSGGGSSSPLLIECGLGIDQIRRGAGFPLTSFAGCLVSHRHLDHCKAVRDLTRAAVDVWASAETIAALRSDRPHRMHELRPGGWAAVGDWQVLSFEIKHDCEGALGFLVQSPLDDRLLYVTDSCFVRQDFSKARLTHLAVEANHDEDLLRANAEAGVVDGGRFARTSRTHLSIQRLEHFMDACDLSRVQKVWLLHLSSENSNEVEFASRIRRRYGIPCEVAPSTIAGGVR